MMPSDELLEQFIRSLESAMTDEDVALLGAYTKAVRAEAMLSSDRHPRTTPRADSLLAGMPSLLDTDQVAEVLHRRPETVRSWRKAGVGPGWFKIKGTRKVLYERGAVADFITGSMSEAPS